MCGIAGIFDPRGAGLATLERIRKMVGVLRHRGPDEAGAYCADGIALGHARLSIIDIEGGRQPIHNEDGTLWIVYNGEVFNYVELRRGLIEQGHRFYTDTDTEVLLHLYEEKGEACLGDLNGQFAFAIWDARRRELFLARDRVGIRPLHFASFGGSFAFASEAKSLFAAGLVSPEIDSEAIEQVLTFWTTLPGQTAFRGVREVLPGHWLRVTADGTRTEPYWDIPFAPRGEQLDLTPDETAEEARRLLRDAVALRLRADVPVGAYLSGGLDSSITSALVAREFNHDVRTYGIRFEEKAFDEGDHQQRMVRHLGVPHDETLTTNAMVAEALPEAVYHGEKPVLRTAPVPMMLLADLVRRNGQKVVLTGEGADEVFGGYNIFREAKVRRFWARHPQSTLRPLLLGRLYPYIFDDPRLAKSLQSFFAKGLDAPDVPLFSHLLRWRNTSRTTAFLAPELRENTDIEHLFDRVTESLPDAFMGWEPLARAQYLEMRLFMSNYLLSLQGDRMAMAHSVEIRLPFLDHRVIEFMARVPAKRKIRGLNEKYILKKAFSDMLPEEVVRRNKHPFRAPIARSLLGEKSSDCAESLLSDDALRAVGLFDPKRVRSLIANLRKSTRPGEVDSMALVGILSTQILHQRFVVERDFPDGGTEDMVVQDDTLNGRPETRRC